MSKTTLHWINGEWVNTCSHQASIDPATGEKIGTFADGGYGEAERDIGVAKRVHKNSDWKHDRHLRNKAINELADAFEANAGSLREIQSIGVAGIIAPWNSPIILMIRSLAPALVAGCTAVIKMPAQTAQTNFAVRGAAGCGSLLPSCASKVRTRKQQAGYYPTGNIWSGGDSLDI